MDQKHDQSNVMPIESIWRYLERSTTYLEYINQELDRKGLSDAEVKSLLWQADQYQTKINTIKYILGV